MERVAGRFKYLSILFLLIAFGRSVDGLAQSDIETKKIEFLLKEIESQNGAKFWRNNSSYSPKQAVEHLRMKWGKAGSAVKTARDFIDKIASKSSMSGKSYLIEFEDGKKVETNSFLYKKLGEWKP
ncbi:MAG: DUF5329 family protein [Cyclobacteriaceae bacterium]